MSMMHCIQKEEAWFQEWFDFMVKHTQKTNPTDGAEKSIFDEGKEDQKEDCSLVCVTTLYQKECFPMLYIQKNKGFMRNHKMVIDIHMILRTDYEGRSREASCLQKIASILRKPYVGAETKTNTLFVPQSMTYKSGDKKIREIVLAYDARIVWDSHHTDQE